MSYALTDLYVPGSFWGIKYNDKNYWAFKNKSQTFTVEEGLIPILKNAPSLKAAKQWLWVERNVPTTGWKDNSRHYFTQDHKWALEKREEGWKASNLENYKIFKCGFTTRVAALDWINGYEGEIKDCSEDL